MARPFRNVCLALGASLVASCGLPDSGTRLVVQDRQVSSADASGAPITGYDLVVYRCTWPGSQLDREFAFPAQTESTVRLVAKSEVAAKTVGGTWLAPDFYLSYEPEPYWVACVDKAGFKSRRWSLNETQGDPVSIVLIHGAEAGSDSCKVQIAECNPCRSYEYNFYGPRRYRHNSCGL
jgi:hypothetical protein